MTTQQQFVRKLNPHRGKGVENTLEAIAAGIAESPFMVEFDVSWIDDDLYLGHPYIEGMEAGHPAEYYKTETLSQALKLFEGTSVMPKVDLKLSAQTLQQALEALSDELSKTDFKKILVNISGVLERKDLSSRDYMQAERDLLNATPDNVVLNIDLQRYRGVTTSETITTSEIDDHIKSLARAPFSLSPNLEEDHDAAIAFALNHSIPTVHYWAYPWINYEVDGLIELLEKTEERGLHCHFSLFEHTIMSVPHSSEVKGPVSIALLARELRSSFHRTMTKPIRLRRQKQKVE